MRTTGPWLLGTFLGCTAPGAGPDGDDTDTVADTETADTGTPDTGRDGPPNLLVVLLDDVGLDQVRIFGWPDAPELPTLEALAAEGVSFDRAFTAPTCSPSRALLLTGRYGRRTGIGRTVVAKEEVPGLPRDEVGIASVLAAAPTPYATAAVGKWHLSTFTEPDGLSHPAALGFDRWSIAMGNLGGETATGEATQGYLQWERDRDGTLEVVDGYATSVQVDDALAMSAELPEPWFVWLAFSAPHAPFHPPPTELQDDTPVGLFAPPRAKYRAMLQAADTELGRLLDGLGPQRARTTVVVIGDNGTPGDVVRRPLDPLRAKDSLYDLGTRVPIVVAGPGVPGRGVAHGLVHAVDLFPTLAALGGAVAGEGPWPAVLDGTSFAPLLEDPALPARELIYTERFAPNGRALTTRNDDARAVRDASWRLIRDADGDHLFAVGDDDLDDGPDLLADAPDADALAAAARLGAALDGLEGELGP
ncbi:MAG: sulfatase-like hydrolase/transferase [Alphaproteobacteria bacterium]|nr:sulfatase-like hydrolase/transferase [Alphaproteobacteria bacterium]